MRRRAIPGSNRVQPGSARAEAQYARIGKFTSIRAISNTLIFRSFGGAGDQDIRRTEHELAFLLGRDETCLRLREPDVFSLMPAERFRTIFPLPAQVRLTRSPEVWSVHWHRPEGGASTGTGPRVERPLAPARGWSVHWHRPEGGASTGTGPRVERPLAPARGWITSGQFHQPVLDQTSDYHFVRTLGLGSRIQDSVKSLQDKCLRTRYTRSSADSLGFDDGQIIPARSMGLSSARRRILA